MDYTHKHKNKTHKLLEGKVRRNKSLSSGFRPSFKTGNKITSKLDFIKI